MASRVQAALVVSVIAAAAGAASASTLYGETYSGAPDSSLYSFNQSTGAATLIGSTGAAIGDLTSAHGTLLGIDLGTDSLTTIDAATGAATGSVALHGANGIITSIAYDPVNGVLYGNTTNGFGGDDALYRINTATGAATRIGAIGVTDLYALGFGTNGVLYAADSNSTAYTLDITTGAGSLLGSTGSSFVYDIAARPEDGVLFAADNGNETIDTLNPSTGVITIVGGYGYLNMAGLAFIGASAPEPTAWAMMIVGLFGVGAMLRRRAAIATA